MKRETVKAHKKASRKNLEKVLIQTTTKVIKNKKRDHRSRLKTEDL